MSLLSINDATNILATIKFSTPSGTTIKEAKKYAQKNITKELFEPPYALLLINDNVSDIDDSAQVKNAISNATKIKLNSYAPIEHFNLMPGETKSLKYGIVIKGKTFTSLTKSVVTPDRVTTNLKLMFNHGDSKTIVNHFDLKDKEWIKQ